MRILSYVGLATLAAMGVCSAAGPAPAARPIKTVGLYAFQPNASQYKFWRACGYNTLQFIEHGFPEPEASRDALRTRLAKGIEEAQKAGFKVWVILLSNVTGYPDYPSKPAFDPTDMNAMRARLDGIEKDVRACKMADGFTFFGGDPGGSPKDLGPGGVRIWERMAENVHSIVNREAPGAEFNVNIWATAAWEYMGINPFKEEFWLKEVAYGKQFVDAKDFVGADCGIEFPMHNYYRSLAMKAYDAAGLTPEPYPAASEIAKLRARGTERMWTWAHFLIDEVDDGYTGYSGVKSHPAQAETRYLHRIVSDSRDVGLNGVISNSSGEDTAVEQMNIYAFARFANDASLTPENVIDEYSALLAEKETAPALSQVIRFIENHSTWEASYPEKYRLPKLPCSLNSAKDAIAALDSVRPAKRSRIPLPEPAAKYLQRLRDRLVDIEKQG